MSWMQDHFHHIQDGYTTVFFSSQYSSIKHHLATGTFPVPSIYLAKITLYNIPNILLIVRSYDQLQEEFGSSHHFCKYTFSASIKYCLTLSTPKISGKYIIYVCVEGTLP